MMLRPLQVGEGQTATLEPIDQEVTKVVYEALKLASLIHYSSQY